MLAGLMDFLNVLHFSISLLIGVTIRSGASGGEGMRAFGCVGFVLFSIASERASLVFFVSFCLLSLLIAGFADVVNVLQCICSMMFGF